MRRVATRIHLLDVISSSSLSIATSSSSSFSSSSIKGGAEILSSSKRRISSSSASSSSSRPPTATGDDDLLFHHPRREGQEDSDHHLHGEGDRLEMKAAAVQHNSSGLEKKKMKIPRRLYSPPTKSNKPVAILEDEEAKAAATTVIKQEKTEEELKAKEQREDSTTKQLPDYFRRRTREEMRFVKSVKRPRDDLAPDATDPKTGLPILHPKAMNLPMPPPTPDLVGEPEKWSFSIDTTKKKEHLMNMYAVPNSEAPALLPMHMSSLTVPSMEKRRFCAASWSSLEDAAPISDDRVHSFLDWIKATSSSHGAASDLYHAQLDENISLCLGHRMVRGVYAKKHFSPGDVILDIPIDQDPTNVKSYGQLLNSERTKLCSRIANHEHVKMPSFDAVYDAIVDPRHEFEIAYHPLFVDQMLLACYIGQEKAAGKESPLYPYLSLFPSHSLFDDQGLVMELHKGVVSERSIFDYKDHLSAFRFNLVKIRELWPAGGTPPPLNALFWGLRFVLSRQMMLPHMRVNTDDMQKHCTDSDDVEVDMITSCVRKVHRFFLDRVLGALDKTREKVNYFDPHTAPTVVPLLDMIQHDPAGISANISISVEGGAAMNTTKNTASPDDVDKSSKKGLGMSVVVRATEEILKDQPLQILYPRCFSLGYTLFRYGFLPLRHRDLDRRKAAEEFDVVHVLPAKGTSDEIGTGGQELPRRFLESTPDGKPPPQITK